MDAGINATRKVSKHPLVAHALQNTKNITTEWLLQECAISDDWILLFGPFIKFFFDTSDSTDKAELKIWSIWYVMEIIHYQAGFVWDPRVTLNVTSEHRCSAPGRYIRIISTYFIQSPCSAACQPNRGTNTFLLEFGAKLGKLQTYGCVQGN